MTYIIDIETNALENPSKIHCCVLKNVHSEEVIVLTDCFQDILKITHGHRVVGHNIIDFDAPVLESFGIILPKDKILDTYILSKLLNFNLDNHSLAFWGVRFNLPKIDDITDFSVCTPRLIERCISDVQITFLLYKKLSERLHFEL